jgi:hypothetical protein
MLETIEETEENANLIARADFKKKFGEDLNDVPDWIRSNWISVAWQMLDNYNCVVELLNDSV